MRPVGFGKLFTFLFIYFIHDIVYPYTTRGWKILDYSTCCRKHHSIYDLVMFSGNTSRIIENFQYSSCIIRVYEYSTSENITDYSTSGRGEYFKQTLIIIFIQGNYYFLTKLTEQ
jgi:hypothetical protein